MLGKELDAHWSRISISSAVVAGKTFYPNHYETLCLGPDECVSSVHFQAVDVLLKVLQFKKLNMYIVFAFKEGLTAYSFNPLRSKPNPIFWRKTVFAKMIISLCL